MNGPKDMSYPKASERCFGVEGLLETRQIRKKKKTLKVVGGEYSVGRHSCQNQALREKEQEECISRKPTFRDNPS